MDHLRIIQQKNLREVDFVGQSAFQKQLNIDTVPFKLVTPPNL